MVRIEFDRRGLVPLCLVVLVLGVAGVALLLDDYVLLGRRVDVVPRTAFGLAACLLAAWLLRCVLIRGRSDDPAIRIDGSRLHLHVNPGWRLTLAEDEVVSVGPVVAARSRVTRWVQGRERFEIVTTRQEGWRSATVLVCSRYVRGDLATARDQVATALAAAPGS